MSEQKIGEGIARHLNEGAPLTPEQEAEIKRAFDAARDFVYENAKLKREIVALKHKAAEQQALAESRGRALEYFAEQGQSRPVVNGTDEYQIPDSATVPSYLNVGALREAMRALAQTAPDALLEHDRKVAEATVQYWARYLNRLPGRDYAGLIEALEDFVVDIKTGKVEVPHVGKL